MLCGSSREEEVIFIVMTHRNWFYVFFPSDLKLNDLTVLKIQVHSEKNEDYSIGNSEIS